VTEQAVQTVLFPTLIRQRCFGLACGYADANDAARLKADPIHKLLVGRDPVGGLALASQPTLSRFENVITPRDLYRLTQSLADLVIAHHQARLGAKGVPRITIDLDPTDDPTHGQQELTCFNGHYDSWCHLPLVGTLTFNRERTQHLVTAILRPGNAHATLGVIGILRGLFLKLRRAFPAARVRARLDGGFASPALFTFLEAQGVEYLVVMASNAKLEKGVRRLLGKARMRSQATGETAHLFGETRYAAKSWRRKRRVIMKAEVVRLVGRDPRDNPRFVVTNLRQSPRRVYAIYRERGDVENRLKELHYGLGFDRTSCTAFWANAFRVLLTAAAYVLLRELGRHLASTACAASQVGTLGERLLKLGARVTVSARRIVLHLPSAFPWLAVWQAAAWPQLALFSSGVRVYAAPRREMPTLRAPPSRASPRSLLPCASPSLASACCPPPPPQP
jgi:hypothetical protein